MKLTNSTFPLVLSASAAVRLSLTSSWSIIQRTVSSTVARAHPDECLSFSSSNSTTLRTRIDVSTRWSIEVARKNAIAARNFRAALGVESEYRRGKNDATEREWEACEGAALTLARLQGPAGSCRCTRGSLVKRYARFSAVSRALWLAVRKHRARCTVVTVARTVAYSVGRWGGIAWRRTVRVRRGRSVAVGTKRSTAREPDGHWQPKEQSSIIYITETPKCLNKTPIIIH